MASDSISITRTGSQLHPKVELFGDWDKVQRALAMLPTAITVGTLAGERAALESLKRLIRARIRENGSSYNWAPLAAKTLHNKRDSTYPDSILRMTGLIYRNIVITGDGFSRPLKLGIKERVRYPKRGTAGPTVNEVAIRMEYGYGPGQMPARPLWGPAYKEFGGEARIKGYIIWHVRNQIQLIAKVKAQITF